MTDRLGTLRDVVAESLEAIGGRRVRSALTLLGVAFGILALVATVGLTSSAAAQVSARFDALKATSVTIDGAAAEEEQPIDAATGLRGPAIDPDGVRRTARLNGVASAGVMAITKDTLPQVSRVGSQVPSAAVETPVLAADVGAVAALRLRPLAGRLFDQVHQDRRYRVALLGDVAARNLGIDPADPSSVDGRTTVYIAGRPYLLLGIVTTPDFESQAPLAAVVPEWVTRDPAAALTFADPRVIVKTRPGAAQQVGVEAKVALDPARPGRLIAQVPPDPRQLRAKVETDTRTLFLVMAAVSLLIGAIGIGNTTLVAVLERRQEIGLRRAIGASRRSILVQFLLESGMLGLLGGVVGTIAALDLTIGIALSKDWTAAIPPWLIGVGPLLGLVVGLVAGIYPSAKAARMEPVTALA
ncbi:ABC transporter permease [Actinomadura flavalba]|uniref:ABC transporter permease n=1 Tax=Actinomadura flavalba TaxID=1120938 RepID=UPI00036C7D57|nr:ABC transporter permease [Actinomadura flavalba]